MQLIAPLYTLLFIELPEASSQQCPVALADAARERVESGELAPVARRFWHRQPRLPRKHFDMLCKYIYTHINIPI